jgi:hypothetical protein
MLRARGKTRSSSGHTLLEVVISVVVLLTVLGAVMGVIASSQGAYVEMSAALTAEETANRILDRIVWELRFAPLDTISLTPSTDARSVTFSRVQGWNAGARVLSGPQALSFDSGRVLWNGTTIAGGVGDLTFNLSGNVITAVLDLERTADVAGFSRTFKVKREVKVALRT